MEFALTLPSVADALAEFTDAFESLLHARSDGSVSRHIMATPGGLVTTVAGNVVLPEGTAQTTWRFERGPDRKHLVVGVESNAAPAVLEAVWHDLSQAALDTRTWTPHWRRRFYRYIGRPLHVALFVPGKWYCIPARETMSGDMLTERYVAIDVSVPAVSDSHAARIAQRRRMHDEVAAFVSFAWEVGMRPPASQRVWTFTLGDASSEVRQVGCLVPSLPLNASGEPHVEDDAGELNILVSSAWALADRLSQRDRRRFIHALDALRTGLVLRGDLNLSHAAGAHVAIAIEALSGKQSEKEFTEFLVRYAGPSLPPEVTRRLPAQAKDYYGWVRSTYVHGRESYVDESDPFERIGQLATGTRALGEILFPAIVRAAVVGWLAEHAAVGSKR